jgi:hypothetical protein
LESESWDFGGVVYKLWFSSVGIGKLANEGFFGRGLGFIKVGRIDDLVSFKTRGFTDMKIIMYKI